MVATLGPEERDLSRLTFVIRQLAEQSNSLSQIEYATRADVQAASIAGSIGWVRTRGYTAVGDGGGANYTRVSSLPSHQMYIQSTDGAYWEFTPDHPGYINACQAGVKADGTEAAILAATATDNRPPILAIQSYMLAKQCPNPLTFVGKLVPNPAESEQYVKFTIEFPPGEVFYTGDNYFNDGCTLVHRVARAHVLGHNTVFKPASVAENTAYGVSDPFGVGTFVDATHIWPGVTTKGYPQKINTTAVGNTSITVTTPGAVLASPGLGNSSWPRIGGSIVILSLAHQSSSLPANPYKFEFRTVTTVDTVTGIIGIDQPLEFIHRSTDPDPLFPVATNAPGGAARYLWLDDTFDFNFPAFNWFPPAFWDVEHTFENIEFSNRRSPAVHDTVDTILAPGKRVKYINCTAHLITFTQTQFAETDGCTILGAWEIDKQIEFLRIVSTDSPAGSAIGSGSIRFCEVINSNLGAGSAFYPCNALVVNSKGGIGIDRGWSYHKYIFQNCYMTIATSPEPAVVLAANYTYAAGRITMLRAISESDIVAGPLLGQRVFPVKLYGAVYRDSGCIGIVTALSDDGGTHIFCDTTLPDPLPAGLADGIGFERYNDIQFENCTGDPSVSEYSYPGGGIRERFKYTFDGGGTATALTDRWVRGYFKRITVNVTRAYTGANGAEVLTISGVAFDSGFVERAWSLVIDLKTAGLRVIDQFRFDGKVAGDSFTFNAVATNLLAQAWMSGAGVNIAATAFAGGDTAAMLPFFTLDIEADQTVLRSRSGAGSSTTIDERF